MRHKVLTKDCPSCKAMKINDSNKFECHWGNSKKVKILHDAKSKSGLKECKLIRKK